VLSNKTFEINHPPAVGGFYRDNDETVVIGEPSVDRSDTAAGNIMPIHHSK
jgi:hypothetical protein